MSAVATAGNALAKIVDFLAKLPPEALPAVWRMFTAILSGDTAKAEREARVSAETVASKRGMRAAYAAGARARAGK